MTRLLDILDEVRLNPSRMDYRRWKLDQSGMFSCHSFYSFIQDNGSVEEFPPYNQIWKSKTPQKVKILVWQVAIGKVNICDLMQRHRPSMCLSPHRCVFCILDGESVDHKFIHCTYSIKVWWLLLREVEAVWVTPKGCFQLLSSNFAAGEGEED